MKRLTMTLVVDLEQGERGAPKLGGAPTLSEALPALGDLLASVEGAMLLAAGVADARVVGVVASDD